MPFTPQYKPEGRAELFEQMQGFMALNSVFDNQTEVGKNVSKWVGGNSDWMELVQTYLLEDRKPAETDEAFEKRREIFNDLMEFMQKRNEMEQFVRHGGTAEAGQQRWDNLMNAVNRLGKLSEKLLDYNDMTKNALIHENAMQAAFGIARGIQKMQSKLENIAIQETYDFVKQLNQTVTSESGQVIRKLNNYIGVCTLKGIPVSRTNDIIVEVNKKGIQMTDQYNQCSQKKQEIKDSILFMPESSDVYKSANALMKHYDAMQEQLLENEKQVSRIETLVTVLSEQDARVDNMAAFNQLRRRLVEPNQNLANMLESPEESIKRKMETLLNKTDMYKGRFHSDSTQYKNLKNAMQEYCLNGGRDRLDRVRQTADEYLRAKEGGGAHSTFFSSKMRYFRLALANSVKELAADSLEKTDKLAALSSDTELKGDRVDELLGGFQAYCQKKQPNSDELYNNLMGNFNSAADMNMASMKATEKQLNGDFVKNRLKEARAENHVEKGAKQHAHQ